VTSAKTLRKTSYKTVGIFLKEQQLKPFIGDKKKRLKRLDFAKNWIGDTQDKLGCIFWSDETVRYKRNTHHHT
jgi:hypothetical protein